MDSAHNGLKKRRLVEEAATTILRKLDAKIDEMNEMKSWENERLVLQNQISRLKKEKKEQIRLLATSKESLAMKVRNLTNSLAEADGQKKIIQKLEKDDKKIEEFLVNSGKTTIRLIDNLSSELVSTNKALCETKNGNKFLQFAIDELRARIMISGGDSTEHRNLGSLVARDACFVTNNLEDPCSGDNFLIDKDRQMRGCTQSWSIYLNKITELEYFTESLILQLERIQEDAKSRGSTNLSEYQQDIRQIEEHVGQLASDLKTLKIIPIKIDSRINGESCVEYLKQIRTLKKLVKNSASVIDKLIIGSKKDTAGERQIEHDKDYENKSKRIDSLQFLVNKLKSGFKELEVIVISIDSQSLIGKIYELETSVRRLKGKLAMKNEKNSSLNLELAGAKISFEEKSKELEKLKRKYERIANKIKKRGHDIEIEDQRVSSLLRELEESKLEVQVTISEVKKIRSVAEERSIEIQKLSKEKKCIEQELMINADMQTNLTKAQEETNKLKKEIAKCKAELELLLKKPEVVDAESDCQLSSNELNRLRDSLGETSENYKNLKNKWDQLNSEKAKIELDLSGIKAQNDTLKAHVNSGKATIADNQREIENLTSNCLTLKKDYQNVEIERLSLKNELDNLKQDNEKMKAQIDELRQENILTSSLKFQLLKSNRDLDESNAKNAKVQILNEEISHLNNELDNVRSDKLNLAGSLTDIRIKYEEVKKLLDSKTVEARDLQARLEDMRIDFEIMKTSEASLSSEVERLLKANTKLRETIDVTNLDKTRMETLDNECRALQARLVASETDNEALRGHSSVLRQQVDKLMQDIEVLTAEKEKTTCDYSKLVTEHQNLRETSQKNLEDLKIERESLKIELARLRFENSSLRNLHERITAENEQIGLHDGGKKTETNRLREENESLKFELAKLRGGNSKADHAFIRSEKDKVSAELPTRHDENNTIKVLLRKAKTMKDSRKLEERIKILKAENDELKKYIEHSDDREKAFKTEKSTLNSTITELIEHNKISKQLADEMNFKNNSLINEINQLKINLATGRSKQETLEKELDNLRDTLVKANDDNTKTFEKNAKQLETLKEELVKERREKSILQTNFDKQILEYRRLDSENETLKYKLEKLKRSWITSSEEDTELRSKYKNLKEVKHMLESELMDARKEIGKYTITVAKLNPLENKLKALLNNFVLKQKKLRSAYDEINHLRSIIDNSTIMNSNYNEKIRASQ